MTKKNMTPEQIDDATRQLDNIFFLNNTNQYDQFVSYWNSLQNKHSLFDDLGFLRLLSQSIVIMDKKNQQINDFIILEIDTKYNDQKQQILNNLNEEIFWTGVQVGNITYIERYFPREKTTWDFKEMSQKFIKYGHTESINWFIKTQVAEKKQPKFLQFAQKECFSYLFSGFSSYQMLDFVSSHPQFKEQPLKQQFYDLILKEQPELLMNILQNEKIMACFKEVNLDFYYKILVNKIIEIGEDGNHPDLVHLFENSLIQSYDTIPFEFITPSMIKKTNKHPTLNKILNSIYLKEKLDYLEEKPVVKKYKI